MKIKKIIELWQNLEGLAIKQDLALETITDLILLLENNDLTIDQTVELLTYLRDFEDLEL